MLEYINTGTSEAMADRVVKILLALALEKNKQHKPFVLALAGGSTPQLVYKKLSFHKEKMRHWILVYSDERFLPDQHPDRNESLFRQAFGSIPDTIQHHPCLTPQDGTLEYAAAHYQKLVNSFETIDVCLLGLGEDGHSASLFPENIANDKSQKSQTIIAVNNASKAPAFRLSFHYRLIAECQNILFLITGAAKLSALSKAIENNDMLLPITHILKARKTTNREQSTLLLADNSACENISVFQ